MKSADFERHLNGRGKFSLDEAFSMMLFMNAPKSEFANKG